MMAETSKIMIWKPTVKLSRMRETAMEEDDDEDA